MTVVGYLDAGSGSMLVGAVAAAGAGVAVAAKVGWRRVAGAFGGKNKLEDAAAPADEAGTEETVAEPDATVSETPEA